MIYYKPYYKKENYIFNTKLNYHFYMWKTKHLLHLLPYLLVWLHSPLLVDHFQHLHTLLGMVPLQVIEAMGAIGMNVVKVVGVKMVGKPSSQG